jgi:hypothetical protein
MPPVPREVVDRDASVAVTVRDGADGPPLARATVRALAIVEGRAYRVGERETDEAGRAALAELPRGELWIVAEAKGHARGSTHLVLDAEDRALAIDLVPEHAIEVVVRDDANAPVSGAEVEVVAPGDPLPIGARVGDDGAAHVGRLGPGPWSVTARAPGYEEAPARAQRDGERLDLLLRKLGALTVHVADEDARGVPGARVMVAGVSLWPARAAATEANGDVRIGGLGAGTYALRATLGDLVSPIELGVVLGRGEEKAVDLRLAPGRWVAVRVTDGDEDDAAPVASARITLAEGGLSPFPFEATADARGRARLGPISPGNATVGVRADGFVPRGTVAVVDPPPPETRIGLVRAGAFTGRVVDERGFPVDGASVEIVGTDPAGAPIFDDPRRARFQAAHFEAMLAGPAPLVPVGDLGVMPGPVPAIPHADMSPGARAAGAGFFSSTAARGQAEVPYEPWVTRSDGTFRAAPASPGRVRAIVHHPQYVEAQSDLVTLAPGGEVHVDVVMHEGGALEGRVVDSRDRAVEGAHVLVSAMRGSLERTTRTASDGSFAFASLPEAVSLTASVDDDQQPDVRLALEIPAGARKTVTIRLPEPRAPLAVVVVDDRDRAIDTAQVRASSLAADVPLRTTAFTDARGEATLKRARGLPLRIEAGAPGFAPRVLSTDGTNDSLKIELSPAERATGEVIEARGGAPIAGAEVTLYTDLGVRRTRTDAQGAFSLGELAPGDAGLRVRASGYAPFAKSVRIADSRGRRPGALPRIELAAEGSVEGEVVDVHGNPVAGARVAKDHAPTWLVVGATPPGLALTNTKGQFVIRELPEGAVAIEAYAPDLGRARVEGVQVSAGRATTNVRIELQGDQGSPREPMATGSVAVTLGQTSAPVEVVVVSVAEGSEAERAGLAPGDVLLSVDDVPVGTIEEARTKLSGPVADDVVVRVRRADQALSLRVTREAVRR